MACQFGGRRSIRRSEERSAPGSPICAAAGDSASRRQNMTGFGGSFRNPRAFSSINGSALVTRRLRYLIEKGVHKKGLDDSVGFVRVVEDMPSAIALSF